MIVSVEGPDGVGKSGYAEWLSNELGCVHVPQDFSHFPHSEHDLLGYARHKTVMAYDDAGVDAVLDRGPLSSMVYARVRERSYPSYARDTLETMDPIIVYLSCDPEELSARHDEDQPYVDICATYDKLIDGLYDDGFRIREIDTTTEVLESLREICEGL